MRRLLLLYALALGAATLVAAGRRDTVRECILPIDMPPYLAGNFGELRPDHFHAGLDFKTGGTVGHPVYAFDDGYVARAAVNAYGYGLVLYVNHPSGLTTVYAHLDGFADSIAARVLAYQMTHEISNPDISFAPGDIVVRRGERIATSGNTGSSGGPHVHFEVRDTRTGEYYDPIVFFLDKIRDTTPPRIRNVYLYPLDAGGRPTGRPAVAAVTASQGGDGTLTRPLTAWGRIGLGLKAYDYMDGTTNTYGVKYVRLYLDDTLIYSFQEHSFLYDERRYVNSLIDYGEWHHRRSMVMKSFREPGNRLRMIHRTVGDGFVDIDEERAYHFRYELQDAFGNVTSLPFVVRGVPSCPAPKRDTERLRVATPLAAFDIDSLGCRFHIPAGCLYRDFAFRLSVKPASARGTSCVSPTYEVGDDGEPLHDYATLAIDLPPDFGGDSSKLYIARLEKKPVPVGGTFVRLATDGVAYVTTEVLRMGRYAVCLDTVPPKVVPLGKPTPRRVAFTIGDSGSGVAAWRGMIDGRFVPFVLNARSQVVARPVEAGVAQRGPHDIELTVTDRCGNVATHRTRVWF